MGQHLINQIQHPELRNNNTLNVIGVCSNYVRWHSRYRLAREWIAAMLKTAGVTLHVVETAFGDRHHELKGEGCPSFLDLRTNTEIWNKENMINLGVRHLLPRDWKYMAWIDMDVFFDQPGWAQETLHQLQHFAVVQPWTNCVDMDSHGRMLQVFNSFGYQHQRRVPKQMHPSQPYQYAHTGYAWACTRAFWEQVKGLPDFCILGSADHHAAFACIGEVKDTIHRGMHENFFKLLGEWEARAVRLTHKEVGFVNGIIRHFWHGAKAKRYYRERWEIIVAHKFDPQKDIMHDSHGVIQLVGKAALEADIRGYNRSRQEDDIH